MCPAARGRRPVGLPTALSALIGLAGSVALAQPPVEPEPRLPPANTTVPCPALPVAATADDAVATDPHCPPTAAPTDEVPDVASLKTPESPAFVALDLAPTQIQRPASPSGLVASLSQGLRRGQQPVLLRDFALEVAPYWLFRHPSLSYEDMLASPGWEWARRFSLSVATSPGTLELTNASGEQEVLDTGRIAVGAQTTLWPGAATVGARRCLGYLRGHTARAVQAFDAEREDFDAAWVASHPRPQVANGPTAPDRAQFFVTVHPETGEPLPEPTLNDEAYDDALVKWRKEYEKWLKDRPGFSDYVAWDRRRAAAVERFVEDYQRQHPLNDPRVVACLSDVNARAGFMAASAGAYSLELPDGDLQKLDQGGRDGWHSWLTLGYVVEDLGISPDPAELSFLVGLHGNWVHGSPESRQNRTTRLDSGVRVALGVRRVGFAVEGTYRAQTREVAGEQFHDQLYRAGLAIDYRLTGGMWLSGSVGKDFGDNEDESPLFALANLQWNFGQQRSIAADGVTP